MPSDYASIPEHLRAVAQVLFEHNPSSWRTPGSEPLSLYDVRVGADMVRQYEDYAKKVLARIERFDRVLPLVEQARREGYWDGHRDGYEQARPHERERERERLRAKITALPGFDHVGLRPGAPLEPRDDGVYLSRQDVLDALRGGAG